MRNINYFLAFCLLNLILCRVDAMKCGDEVIENCVKCGTGDKANTCIECNDKHFLFFNNLFCLPCDDPLYGQVGCGGNCDATDYLETRNVFCEKDGCKEGFYYLNGICTNCTFGSPDCKKCSYTLNENNEEEFKCLECLSDEYYLDPNDGICHGYGCYSHCRKCKHYNINGNHLMPCEECENGFYLDPNDNQFCIKCKGTKEINNGFCRICSEDENDLESGPCWCNNYYTLKNHSNCIKCPDNCPYCQYDQKTNNVECLICDPGYTLNSEKTCTYCGSGCEECSLMDDSKTNCSLCFSEKFESDNKCLVCNENCKLCEGNNQCLQCNPGYILLSDGTCGKCPSNCSTCSVKENDDVICLKCDDQFALKSDKECVYCPNITDEGIVGCRRCGYDKTNNRFECYECEKKEGDNDYYFYNAYTYITNTYQCFDISDNNQPSFYGCVTSYKNGDKYECLACNDDYSEFRMVVNEKVCKSYYDMNLEYLCEEAENIGEEGNEQYSCTKCGDNAAKIQEIGRMNCRYRSGILQYCLEGELDNDNYKCTKCVPNAHLNENDICECDPDSFGYDDRWCYKCDDNSQGNPGCDAEKGCNYYTSNYQLNCNQCKKGYFNYTEGQCYSCSNEIYGCIDCHFEDSLQQLICDQCLDGFIYDNDNNQCTSNNCINYPEIPEGCVICDQNKEEYISNKICHNCESDYFKTRDKKCIQCNLEEYGGNGCSKCKYSKDENDQETNEIICEYCPVGNDYFSSNGKCLSCQQSFPNCEICEIKKNNDNNEKIICNLCKPGFYLNSEGKCIDYLKYLEKIPNCERYSYQINNIMFCTYYYKDNYYDYENEYYYDYYDTYYCIRETRYNYDYYYYDYDYNYYTYNYDSYKNYYNYLDFNIPAINDPFKAKCIRCESNYYLNSEGNCVQYSDEDCSLISILNDFPKKYLFCRNYCSNSGNTKYIQATFRNASNNGSIETLDFNEFFNNYLDKNNNDYAYDFHPIDYNLGKKLFDNLDNVLKPLFIKNKLCIKIPEDTNDFQNCNKVTFDEKTNSYICSECYNNYDYILENNRCTYIRYNSNFDEFNCPVKNIGTIDNPIYSCTECYNDDFLLVTSEKGIKYCVNKYQEDLEYCTEADVDTKYFHNKYNCTNCSLNFLPYYSKFFERKICQNIFDEIITEKKISLDIFEELEGFEATEEGICEDKNSFTPNGKKCFKCNNKDVGMPGCKGACSFSLKRNDVIKCEDGCDTGYIEIREGVCEPCENILPECEQCHYETDYPLNYLGIKREGRLVCDSCKSGSSKVDGQCVSCNRLGKCAECELDNEKEEDYHNYNIYYNLICKKCIGNAFLSNGYCLTCEDSGDFQKGNKCIDCDDFENGGIKGCRYCEKNNNDELICQLCKSDYILLSHENKCLDITEYEGKENMDKFYSCEKLALDDNNELYCSRCKKEYFLLKNNDNDKGNCHDSYGIIEYLDYPFYPCQEGINIGTEENPKYSCTKCYQIFEFTRAYKSLSSFTRILNQNDETGVCIYQEWFDLENCTEAINKTTEDKEIFDCQKCIEDNQLVTIDNDIKSCQYSNSTNSNPTNPTDIKKCLVIDCKTCKNGDSYFCTECESSEFEANSATGQCVKKTEIVAAITWKDIYRLEMNGQHERNGQTFNGPSLILRGITSSQINTRHGFLIYLTFKVKTSRYRNLEEEEIRIPAICEALNSVEATGDDVNMIDYECLANITKDEDLSNYNLGGIEEGDNEGVLKKSNLNTLTEGKTMEDFIKAEPSFTEDNLQQYVIFKMNEVPNPKAINYKFDFTIEGQLTKQINIGNSEQELELNEIEDKVNCNFIVENEMKAKLKCGLDINKYQTLNTFSFKTSEIKTDNNDIFIPKLDEVLLTNDIKEEEEEKDNDEDKKDKKDKKNYTGIIIGCVIGGVVIISAAIVLTICLVKRAKKQDNININEITKNRDQKEIEGNNEERVSRFENNPKTDDKINK